MFCNLNDPQRVNKNHLGKVLAFFIAEVRRKDGGEYEGRTLYDIVICLQFHFEKAGLFWKLIDNKEFQNLKSRCSSRLGTVGSAKPISFEEETKMWVSGALGEDTPDKLCNTVLFLIGLSCTLRGGEEHRRLRCPPHDPQIVVKHDVDGSAFLVYTEDDKSKTFQGGIHSRPKKRKVVPIHGNRVHPEHDLVRLYQKYVALLLTNGKCQALYKYSLGKNRLSPGTWYSDKPMGVNALKVVVKTIAKEAGLEGKFSNHRTGASTATRLFQSGVDEQIIKEVTGHKSDTVRMYKHSNTQLLREASTKVISNEPVKQEPAPNMFEWDDKNYCDQVLNSGKPEKIERHVMPGENKAHKMHCHSSADSGGCNRMCTILKQIDKKQAEHKLKKIKLSLKYRRN